MNTFDWLAKLDIHDVADEFDLVEVSFKTGSRKEFFHNPPHAHVSTGDWVLTEIPGGSGYDVGQISLMGDLVKLQLKKKAMKESAIFLNIIRRAHGRDLEKHDEVRTYEREMLVRARAVARTLDLDMKIGDIEFQGDGRKVTIYYTADGRVDFRELIRHYAKDFKVKIEMRQIGARQESARIGGIGTCGRELCCSTWLSDFKSVSTAAARYQQLAINQAKLSGMCGRLKCCLNYELDSYLDALEDFPQNPDRIKTHQGRAELIKTDVFRRLMTYVMAEGTERGKFFTLGVAEVKEVLSLNKRGEMPASLRELQFVPAAAKPVRHQHHGSSAASATEEDEEDYEEDVDYGGDLVGAIELADDKRKKKKKKKKRDDSRNPSMRNNASQNPNAPRDAAPRPPRDNANRPPNPPRDGQQRPPKDNANRPPNTLPDNANRPPKPDGDNQTPPRNDRRDRWKGNKNQGDGRKDDKKE